MQRNGGTVDLPARTREFGVRPPRSGKGTVARVLAELVGKANVCGPTLASLGTPFGLAPLPGKSLAIISDARLGGWADGAVVVERLLSISGEDSLSVPGKLKEDVTLKLNTRLAVFTNERPKCDDASGALAKRYILLRMERSFYGQEDTGLLGRLLAELPGVLNWSIEGWRRLRERGHFLRPDGGREMLEEMSDLASPVGQFVRECCVLGAAGYSSPRLCG